MNIDALTGQFESVLERARTQLDQEIARARKVVDGLNAEKSSAQNALTQLRAQVQGQQDQLDAVMKQLGRASSLAALESEIKKAGKELEGLKTETAKATTALEGLVKQQRVAEGQAATLRMEASSLAAAKAETEARMRSIRERFFG